MTKFHLTKDGPKICKANKRECPVGGEHFDHYFSAQDAFEVELQKEFDSLEGIQREEFLAKDFERRDEEGSIYHPFKPHDEISQARLDFRAANVARQANRFEKLKKSVAPEGMLGEANGIRLHVGGGKDWGSYKGVWSSWSGLLGTAREEAVRIENEYIRRGEDVPPKLAAVTAEAEQEKQGLDWLRKRIRDRFEGKAD